jgi:L-ascorbate metabolism protein UlaG (beta-lactamase superfamily)
MLLGFIASAVLLLIVYLFMALRLPIGADPAGDRLKHIKAQPNYQNGRFINTLPTEVLHPGTTWETLRLWIGHEQRVPPAPPAHLPVVYLNAQAFSQKPSSGLRITWLGHSTFVVELDGQVILTDPVLGERAYPLSWIGPKRFHPSPISLADLPPLDAVVISHDHYDHLECDSIRKLLPKTKRFIVPLGIGAHLEHWGVPSDRIVELNWWEESVLPNQVRLMATPARHYSGRFLKRNNTLWSSWAFVGPKYRIYFSGDSGMTADEFKAIGEQLGPFDFTLIKIGAYGQTWPDIHITPEEAILVHTLVQGKVLVPAHWGTFNMAFHAWNEPIERLQAAAQQNSVQVIVPKPGQSFGPDKLPFAEPWWRTL